MEQEGKAGDKKVGGVIFRNLNLRGGLIGKEVSGRVSFEPIGGSCFWAC